MRSSLAAPLLLIFYLLFPAPVRAAGIVDLQFVGEGHTITFSLPDSGITQEAGTRIPMLGRSAAATIDGVSGYTVGGTYYTKWAQGQFPSVILNVPVSIFAGQLLLWGPTVLNDTPLPDSNPTWPYLEDVLVTFIPGTYSLERSTSGWYLDPIAPYTLTITEENSAVPEPASLVLLATGVIAAGGVIRKRRG